jgi:hypothetical protein
MPGKVPGSGRKKGTPNKKTRLLEELLEDKGLEPIQGLADSLKELEGVVTDEPEEKIRVAIAKANIYMELMQYIYPKRKAIQVQQPFDPNEERPLRELSDEELDEM